MYGCKINEWKQQNQKEKKTRYLKINAEYLFGRSNLEDREVGYVLAWHWSLCQVSWPAATSELCGCLCIALSVAKQALLSSQSEYMTQCFLSCFCFSGHVHNWLQRFFLGEGGVTFLFLILHSHPPNRFWCGVNQKAV